MENELTENGSKLSAVMTTELSYRLNNSVGDELQNGKSEADLEAEQLLLRSMNRGTIICPYRDMESVQANEYQIHIRRFSGGELTLYYLGYRFEDFLACLIRQRNDLILKDLLMQEHLILEKVEGTWLPPKAGEGEPCEVRLYETAIVVLPFSGELVRIPYSEISEVCNKDYQLRITHEDGVLFTIGQLGRQLDWLCDHLCSAMQALRSKTEATLQSMLPQIPTKTLESITPFFKEGRAAIRFSIDAVAPEVWSALEEHLILAGVGEEYQFLAALAQKDRICIGIKRGLMGELTGEYSWFLIPIYGIVKEYPGNVVAVEVAGSDQGKATYFFRIMSRETYRSISSLEELHYNAEAFIKDLNRAMVAVNFRREPIYLSDESLQTEEYMKYRFAVAKIPELRMLRRHFIGRIVHSQRWQENVERLLTFNVQASTDAEVWQGIRGSAKESAASASADASEIM